MREQIDLTGTWTFHLDPHDEGEKAAYFAADLNDDRWRQVIVPCAFEDCVPNIDYYAGAGWFRRRVRIPDTWRGRRVAIRFEGSYYHTKVWVNGQLAGGNDYGFLRFEIPIHDRLRFGNDNVITVRVDGERRWGELPGAGNSLGWRSYAGILREVALDATDPLRIAHVRIQAEPAPGGGGTFLLRAALLNDRPLAGRPQPGRPQAADVTLRVNVQDATGEHAAHLASGTVTLRADGTVDGLVQGTLAHVTPWSPESPALYTAHAELVSGGQVVDAVDTRFGFRRIEVRDDKLLLNGHPFILKGFNRHEDSPRTAMCPDIATVRQDLIEMKHIGCNFVRLCHYPHHPGELDLCDELGLLAMDEIPLYWWSHAAEKEHGTAEKKLESAHTMLRAMILRDLNHPSIIFWSVSNETMVNEPEVVQGNYDLIRLAKRLDPTRLAVHVSNQWSPPCFDQDDVICINGYASYWGPGIAAAPAFWRDQLAKVHEKCPGKPILFTEFGYPCAEGEFGGMWGEDTAAAAIEAEWNGMTPPYVCGGVIWCWADHPWPKADFVHGVTTSPFGVVSRSRNKLLPYHAAKKIFQPAQPAAPPPGAKPAAPSPEAKPAAPPPEAKPSAAPVRPPEGFSVRMLRNLTDIPDVPMPQGFTIRPMRRDEGPLWLDIWRDAEPYLPISDPLFDSQFGGDPRMIERRCFLIFNQKGVAAGTISAWRDRLPGGKDIGRIHWVGVRPAYQGKGIARAGISYALSHLARWHDRALLDTQTARLAAIKLYLDFGFAPDLTYPNARQAWSDVRQNLPHPALKTLQL